VVSTLNQELTINEDNLDWVEAIEMDKFPPFYAELAMLIGKKNAFKVGLHYQGTVVTFSKLDKLLAKIRNAKIREEFTGDNYSQLATKYHLTERWVRKIIEAEPIESNQITLLELA